MAVVEFSIKDLECLVGKKLSKADFTERMPLIGCPLEKMDGKKACFEVSPNRPDLLSSEGFARAIRAFLGVKKGMTSYKTSPSGIRLHADISVKTVRPYIAAAVLKNVRLKDDAISSFMQLQEKLHDTLGRKRKKVAIGVHDIDNVAAPFTYKAVLPKEIEFVPLGMKEKMNLEEIGRAHPKGAEYIHILGGAKRWPVILDKNGDVLSFPPIINGELTRVTEKTRNIFIDVTGTHEESVNKALNIIAASLSERGAKIETVEITGDKRYVTPNMKPSSIYVDLQYTNKLLDLNFNKDVFAQTLSRMGLGFDGRNVLVPCYRTDVMHEIDIVEDVAIGHGYGKFVPRIPKVPTIAERDNLIEFSYSLRAIMAGMGFQEVVGTMLTNESNEFQKMGLKKENVCETMNALSSECTICRKRLLPSLLNVLSQNMHNEYPQKIFEAGFVLTPDNSDTGARNVMKLACLISFPGAGYESISSVLDALLKQAGMGYTLKKASHASFLDGRTAEILAKNEPVGVMGEIHPQVLNNWKIEKPSVGFELEMEKIFYMKSP